MEKSKPLAKNCKTKSTRFEKKQDHFKVKKKKTEKVKSNCKNAWTEEDHCKTKCLKKTRSVKEKELCKTRITRTRNKNNLYKTSNIKSDKEGDCCKTRRNEKKGNNLKKKNRKRCATDTVITEIDQNNIDEAFVPIKRRCTRSVRKLQKSGFGTVDKVQTLKDQDLESMYHNVFKRFQLNDETTSLLDESSSSKNQPSHYGEGVNPETFQVLSDKIHDLILATKRLGKVSTDAETYLATMLGICTFEQRKKLIDIEKDKFKPILLACKIDNLNVVRFLVEHCCADVNGDTGIGRPLFWAIINANEEMVHYLLECGADVAIPVGDNFNFLMLAMQVFPQKSSGLLGYGQDEPIDSPKKQLDSERISVSLPRDPKTEIVDLLINKGALEKCSDQQLFDCITGCMEEKKDIHKTFLPKILSRISNLTTVRNSKGCSLLGHEISTNYYFVSNFLNKLLENGADVNDTRIVEYHSVPPCSEEESEYSIERNVDSVLKQCMDSIEVKVQNSPEESKRDGRKYVHSIVFLAGSMKITLLSKFLALSQIPFEDKFNALQLIGAYFSNQQYFGSAVDCWKFSDRLKQQKCVQVTRKRIYYENDRNETEKLDWDIDNISLTAAHLLPTPPYLPDCITKFMSDTARELMNLIACEYENCLRQGSIPNLGMEAPKSSFKHHIKVKQEDFLLNDPLAKHRFKILTKSALTFEKFMGYGSYETVKSFDALANEYEKHGLVREFVELISYSYPYFVKYLQQKERKKIYCKAFIRDLAVVLIKEPLHSYLTFEHLMAIWKCFFLDCYVTPRCQRGFMEFSLLLVAIKVIHKWNKTESQTKRFNEFLRKVVKSDLRNLYGQTLLHYTVPTIDNDSIDCYCEVERSQIKEEISGCVELIKLLLAFGADPNAADDHGMTSLHFCYYLICDANCQHNQELAKEVVQTLLEAGAHKDCLDANYQTPIESSMYNSPVPLNYVQDRSLQCLASCVIVESNIQYKGHVANHLEDFIELHRMRGKPSHLNFPSHIFG